jgi:hypothetical protein
VTFDQVVEDLELDLSDDERKALLRQSSRLLVDEPWRTHSSISDDGWTFHVDRDSRLYKGVTTFQEYSQARARQLAALQSAVPGEIWAPRPTAGRLDAAQADSVTPPESTGPEAEQRVTGKVINNHFYASSNIAMDSSNVKQTVKSSPQGDGAKLPIQPRRQDVEAAPTVAAGSPEASHPVVAFLLAAIGVFGIVPTVIQATHAVWAQITGASLVVLTLLLLVLCYFKWNGWPQVRKAGLVIAALLALGIGAVLILGNS